MTTSSTAATRIVVRDRLRAELARRRTVPALAPGDRIRDHVVVRLIGTGGFGDVYHVEHAVLGRAAALKLMHPRHAVDARLRARFEREARVVNDLRHPNIASIYEFGETPEFRPFFVMELLDGEDLGTILERRGRLPPAEVVELLAPVCAALAATHEAGVVHRDIKPSNVFVCRDGRVVLLDFGIAKSLGVPSLTRTDQRVGTPAFMAPEQARSGGPVDARTDIYQLAALAYHLLTGHDPPSAHDPATAHRPAPPTLVAPLDDVIARAMHAEPARRHPSARAFHAALHDAIVAQVEAPERMPTLAIHLEIAGSIPDGVELEAPFEHWRARLAGLGFVCAIETGNSLLFARPTRTDERLLLLGSLLAIASEICGFAATASVALEIAVHAGDADWFGRKPSGGPLMTLDWLVSGRAGIHVSAAVFAQ